MLLSYLTEVYGPNGRLSTSFLPSTRNVLRNIAIVGEELSQYYPLSFDGSMKGISRVSAHLNLSYHQVSTYLVELSQWLNEEPGYPFSVISIAFVPFPNANSTSERSSWSSP
jgi:hypothetical protein